MGHNDNKDSIYMEHYCTLDTFHKDCSLNIFGKENNFGNLNMTYYNFDNFDALLSHTFDSNYFLAHNIYKDNIHMLYNIDNWRNGNQDNIYKDNFYNFDSKYILQNDRLDNRYKDNYCILYSTCNWGNGI